MLGAAGSQIGQFTERKQAEEALRQAYDKIEANLVSLPCAVLIVDQEQRVLYANPLACQHFRPDRATLAGSLLHEVLPLDVAQWHHLVDDLHETIAHDQPA